MTVAGWVGTEESWSDFVPKWQMALGKRRNLHMTDLRWNQHRTRRLLERLGPIPHESGLESAMGGVRFGDYEDLLPDDDARRLHAGYMACLHPMVIQLMKGFPRTERFEFTFEEQKQYAPVVEQALSVLCHREAFVGQTLLNGEMFFAPDGRPRIAKWSFVPKGSTIMIDPADYLAFAIREANTSPRSKKTQWCLPMLNSGDRSAYGMLLNRQQARRIVRRAQILNWLTGV